MKPSWQELHDRMKEYELAVESRDPDRIETASEAVTKAEREHFRKLGVELHEPSFIVKVLPYLLCVLIAVSAYIGIQNASRTTKLVEDNTVTAYKSCLRANELRDGRLDNLRADVANLKADRALLSGINDPEIADLIRAKDIAITAKSQAITDELAAIESLAVEGDPEHVDCFKQVPAARDIDQHLLIEEDDD